MEEILDLYNLQYSDLAALLFDQSPESNGEVERLQSISNSIMQNLGREGPGLLSINGVPKADALRRTLLPLARKLSLLSNDERKRILKEHNLGSDVPLKNLDRIVSSFAMQMKYGAEFSHETGGGGSEVGLEDREFEHLGFTFRELGCCMMELGLSLARVCDRLIGGCELEQSLLQSGMAKGRLIHYHSVADNVLIKQSAIRKRNAKEDVGLSDGDKLDLWQQWHYDYGMFTILTAPMFMASNGIDEQECESPNGHTYLQVYYPKMKRVVMARALEGSLIVQVGEAADVLSKGRLRATLHSVCRPRKMDNLSRETFVAFLQPSWSKTFSLSDYPVQQFISDDQELELCDEEKRACAVKLGSNGLTRNINEIVPPLSLRLQDGMTFAEFSRQTTKQYYGGGGLQPNR